MIRIISTKRLNDLEHWSGIGKYLMDGRKLRNAWDKATINAPKVPR